MTSQEVIRYINRGANYYVSLFGRAEHMEIVQRDRYSLVRPRGDVFGIRFVYNVRLQGLSQEQKEELVAEIKALGLPVWWDLEYPIQAAEPDPEGESYLAMLAGERPDWPDHPAVTEVKTQEEFAQWAGVVNQVLSGGKEDIHPQYHYPLCRDGLLRCYTLGDPAGRVLSAAAAAVDREAASLEFVATVPEHRRQGMARALCCRAVKDAFAHGAEIVTVRAIDGVAAALYTSVGFQPYWP